MLQNLESRIREVIFRQVETSNGYRKIGDLGVTFKKDGLLQSEPTRLQNSLDKDWKEVSEILFGFIKGPLDKTNGFIDNINEVLSTALRSPDGILPARSKTIQSNIDQISRRIDDKNRVIAQKELNFKDRFAKLEETMSKIKAQGASLQGMSGISSESPVHQLG